MMILHLIIAAAVQTPDCLPVTRDRILLRDFAPAIPAFASAPPDATAGFAPVPGATRNFSIGELTRLASLHGVGARPERAICFNWTLKPLTINQVLPVIQQSLGNLKAAVEIIEISNFPVPAGEIVFPLSGLTAPPTAPEKSPAMWRGHITYGVNHRLAVWCRLHIIAQTTRVVAVNALRSGVPIEKDQVRVETQEGFPFPGAVVSQLEEAVGLIPKRPVPAGAPLMRNLLQTAPDVTRGDTIRVEVRSGASRIVMEGKAQTTGRRGEFVVVRNQGSGRTFRALVTGRGMAQMDPTAGDDGRVE